MTYYIFDTACDTKETGSVFPQVVGMREGYDYNSETSIHKLSGDQLPSFHPNLDYVVLSDKANLSDVLSNVLSPFGFLISNKTKSVLQRHNLPLHNFHSAKVMHKGVLYDNYFWFQPVCDLTDLVDSENTEFYVKDTFNNVDKISVSSLKEITDLIPKIGYTKKIVTENLIFKDASNFNLDFFIVSSFDFNNYVSEKLKIDLTNSKITGIMFKQAIHLNNNLALK